MTAAREALKIMDVDDGAKTYTSEDYWNLPEGERAELIDGKLYKMESPSWEHQEIVAGLVGEIRNYIKSHGGPCRVVPSPVAINLDANDQTWVEPDVVVVCDRDKISKRGCEGAPDFVVEVVSPSSRRMDYILKAFRYEKAGVREYWIVDPTARRTMVHSFDAEDTTPRTYAFDQAVPVGIWDGFSLTIAELG